MNLELMSEWERSRLASNLDTDQEILETLSKDESRHIRAAVALNPSTSAEVLRELSKDRQFVVRENIAQNNGVPFDCLQLLAKDHHELVRESVVFNEQCTLDMLKELSKDPTMNVRAAVAMSRNASPEILDELSQDSEMFVKESVLKNNKTWESTREKIQHKWAAKIEWWDSEEFTYYRDLDDYYHARKEANYYGRACDGLILNPTMVDPTKEVKDSEWIGKKAIYGTVDEHVDCTIEKEYLGKNNELMFVAKTNEDIFFIKPKNLFTLDASENNINIFRSFQRTRE
ncbi:HEAT repeat domain-containing protein [Anaerorhabdus sp.]|uniref:HEAT repeat domain-containing protein n=1 Tax=Anaerorhabdus sp. TaxID=1872524 RepID=UPI002FCBEBE7